MAEFWNPTGLRRLLVSYFFAASLRCQASRVAGVTGKTSAQRLRGRLAGRPAYPPGGAVGQEDLCRVAGGRRVARLDAMDIINRGMVFAATLLLCLFPFLIVVSALAGQRPSR